MCVCGGGGGKPGLGGGRKGPPARARGFRKGKENRQLKPEPGAGVGQKGLVPGDDGVQLTQAGGSEWGLYGLHAVMVVLIPDEHGAVKSV